MVTVITKTKKGAGMYEWIAKRRAKAAIVFSPPLKLDIGCNHETNVTDHSSEVIKYKVNDWKAVRTLEEF